jgi:hypothetical protein
VNKKLFKTTLNFFIKWGKVRYRQRDLDKLYENKEKDIQYHVESQLILDKKQGVIMFRYSDMMIQLGYIVMFAQAFPLAPIFAIMSNLIEIKSNINMLSFHSIRFTAEGASGIGVWKNILEFISMTSIVVNSAVVAFTSKSVS